MPTEARHVLVSGRVQGVSFRMATAAQAGQLGLAGWVRNLADGRVEVWVQGAPAAVERMLAWLAHGPSRAQVERLATQGVEPVACDGFEVRPTTQEANPR